MRGSLVFLFTLLCSAWCAPNDLSCKGVAKRSSRELRDCTFQQHAQIQCVYHVTASAGRGKPTFIIEVKNTFKVKPQQEAVTINQTSFPWCLSVNSVHLSRVHQLPESAPNVFSAPATIASSLHDTVEDFSVLIDFNTDASVGFLAVNQGCDPVAHTPPSDACISHLRGTSFIVSPIEMVDFDFQDLISGNETAKARKTIVLQITLNKESNHGPQQVKKFYFEMMNARISSASVRMVQGPEIRNWLPFFQGTKLLKLNLDNNPLYGNLEYKLKGLTELKFLSMRNCSIEAIDQNNFENGAVNLQFLDVSHNKLTEAPAGISALTELQELRMTHQESDEAPFELHENLRGLTNLRALNISHNQLSSIARLSLPNSRHLELLDMSYCELTSLPTDTFQDLVGLKELHLDGNRLNTIPPGTFSKQSPATKVHLRDTGITKAKLAGHKVTFVYDGADDTSGASKVNSYHLISCTFLILFCML